MRTKRAIALAILLVFAALVTLTTVYFLRAAYLELCSQVDRNSCGAYAVAVLALKRVVAFLNANGIAITTIATITISFFTWCLVDSTDKLWRAGEKQMKLSRESSELQLRAYLHVAGASRIVKASKFTVSVRIQNFGQTPAYAVTSWIGVLGVNNAETPHFGIPDAGLKTAKSIIGPGSYVEFSISLDDEFTSEKERLLAEGLATIYVTGEAKYHDVFGNAHVTKYRLMLTEEGHEKGAFQNTEEGNDAT